MNCTVVIDWKFVVAFGTAVVSAIFASKMSATEAEEVLIHAVDACKEYAAAVPGNC